MTMDWATVSLAQVTNIGMAPLVSAHKETGMVHNVLAVRMVVNGTPSLGDVFAHRVTRKLGMAVGVVVVGESVIVRNAELALITIINFVVKKTSLIAVESARHPVAPPKKKSLKQNQSLFPTKITACLPVRQMLVPN